MLILDSLGRTSSTQPRALFAAATWNAVCQFLSLWSGYLNLNFLRTKIEKCGRNERKIILPPKHCKYRFCIQITPPAPLI